MFARSLQFKIILLVAGTLFIGFSMISFNAIRREKERIFAETERASDMMAQPILNTIYGDMLDERPEMVYYLIKDLRTMKGVERVEIVRGNGLETAFSDNKTLDTVLKEYGEIRPQWKTPRIPLNKETAAVLGKNAFKDALRKLTSQDPHVYYIEEENGRRLFTYVVRIEERRKCDSCHGDGMGRGVLMLTTSLEESFKYMDDSWRYWTKTGFLMLALVGIALVAAIRASVLIPIKKMAEAAHVMARGDFTQPLDIKSTDEIGVLAAALNDMETRLKDLYSDLEGQVKERTDELAAANQELAATNQELVATNEELQASYGQLEATSEELEKSNEELKRINDNVVNMEILKTEFIQTVSQELRVPLTPILGYIDLLRDDCLGDLTTKQKEVVEEINLCGRNLQMVVDEVLEISFIQAGNIVPEFDDVDVNSILSSVIKDIRMYADEKSIEIETRLLQGQLWISGDKKRLTEIFTHILRNSLKFTRRSGKVRIESIGKENGVEILITDNGIGIPDDKLKKIHEACRSEGAESSRHFKGVGLGFYLVKRLVDIHNGTMSIDSAHDKGTKVAIFIPRNH